VKESPEDKKVTIPSGSDIKLNKNKTIKEVKEKKKKKSICSI